MSRHSSRRNQSLDRNPGPPPGGSRGDIGSPSGISSSIERGNGSDLEAYSVPIHTIGAAIVCIVGLTGPGNNLTARVADLSRDFARSVLASERSPGIPGASIRPRQTSRRRISGSAFIGYARWKKRGREGSRKRGRDREREERTGSNVRSSVHPSVRPSSPQNLLPLLLLPLLPSAFADPRFHPSAPVFARTCVLVAASTPSKKRPGKNSLAQSADGSVGRAGNVLRRPWRAHGVKIRYFSAAIRPNLALSRGMKDYFTKLACEFVCTSFCAGSFRVRNQ